MSKISTYLDLAAQPVRQGITYSIRVKHDPEEEQELAYLVGVSDGTLAGVMPGAAAIQQREGWTDEAVVCYLNGVGDGMAGVTA